MHYNLSVIAEECTRLANRVNFEKFRQKTVLITGANGLIGGFLADFFCYLNDNYNLGATIHLTSYSSLSNAVRISHLIHRSDLEYFSWDCSNSVSPFVLPKKIDYCFFCSGYGQPSKFLKNNIKTSLINVVGTESLLSWMLSHGGGNFLFLSTSEIYGNPPVDMIPTPESYGGLYDLNNNRAAYKISKCLGEVICKEYNRDDSMNVKIARVALTYGPGTLRNDNRVLQEFIFKADKGEIKMLDGGESLRNYLYITDSVELLINIFSGTELVYNVGGDTEEVSILDLATIISNNFEASVIPGKSKLDSIKTAPKGVSLDMSRVRKEFWSFGQNLTDLSSGVKQVMRWYNLEGKK